LLSKSASGDAKQKKASPIWCHTLCLCSALLSVALIAAIAAFGSSSGLSNQSPSRNLNRKTGKKDTADHIKQKNHFEKHVDQQNEHMHFEWEEADDSFYPTSVQLDVTRMIIKSDRSTATPYYKVDGADDLMEGDLPGLIKETCSASPSNCGFQQYSGYLMANENREIHYWFIESELDPETKPVMIWTNGGPGCSGMDGLLTEHGPWRPVEGGQIAYNPYSWNTEVNMVYLEQPFGVGFSTVGEGQQIVGGDQNAADDMDAAIRDFITKFPQYAENTFFISAESWGGHYVPMTSYTILTNNDLGVSPHINFGGFLVGNPSTDPYENKYGFVGDIYGHGLLKSSDWYTWRERCWGNADAIDNEAVCSAIHTRAYYAAWNANVYALDFPQCYEDENWGLEAMQFDNMLNSDRFMKTAHLHRAARKSMRKVLDAPNYDSLKMGMKREDLQKFHDQIQTRLTTKRERSSVLQTHSMTAYSKHENNEGDLDEGKASEGQSSWDADAYDECIMHWMDDYLNLDEVQSALKVKPTEWGVCSDTVWEAWPESDFQREIEPYYTEIVDKWVDEEELTLVVYSGDDDSVCGLQGTMYWLDR